MKSTIRKLLSWLLVLTMLLGNVPGYVQATQENAAQAQDVAVDTVERYGRTALAALNNAAALLAAYDRIAGGVESAQTEIVLYDAQAPITLTEFQMVLDAYIGDYGEHFWLDSAYGYSLQGSAIYAYSPRYLFTGEELTDVREEFEEALEEMLSCVNDSMTEFEIAVALHDAVAAHITYMECENAHNAYGALINGVCVCEGYAELYQVLLQKCGIQSFLVTGQSYNAGTGAYEGHEWNIVRIDGEYYHVDVTWDDQGEILYHAYFGLTDAAIQEDHILNATGYALPECIATAAQYHNALGGRFETYTVEAVAQHLKDNDMAAFFYIPGDLNAFWAWFGSNFGEIAGQAGLSGSITSSASTLGHEMYIKLEKVLTIVAQGTCGDNLTWKLDEEGTLTISGAGTMANYNDSSNPAPWHAKCTQITSVVIEHGVTSIGDYAFYACWNLEDITIADTVTEIYQYAFYYCSRLSSITIPQGAASIGEGAFYGCSSLTSFTIPKGVTSISGYAFCGCSSLTGFTIPEGVTSIGDYAFTGCNSLTAITIPEGVTDVGMFAFSNCSSLTSITIPDSLISIDWYAFYCCSSLASVTIPEGITNIAGYAFYNCSNLWHVLYTGTEEQWNAITIGSYNSALNAATRHYNCTGDEVTDAVNKVCTICDAICRHDWAEATCTEPKTCRLCGETDGEALGHNWQEATCTAPVTCSGCGTTEGVALGHNYAASVVEPTVDAQGYTLHTCQNCGDSYKDSYVDKLLGQGVCGANLTWKLDTEGTLTISGTGTMNQYEEYLWAPWYKHRAKITSIVIEEGAASIGGYAFYGCNQVQEVTIPSTVAKIGGYAFYLCTALQNVYITDLTAWCGIDFFGSYDNPLEYTQNFCVNGEIVTDLVIPDGVTEVKPYTFVHGCFRSIVFPDGLTEVGRYAFYQCKSLYYTVMPDSLQTIGNDAFGEISSMGVWHVLYKGTEDQWKQIDRNSNYFATIHYEAKGDEVVDAEAFICKLCCEHDWVFAEETLAPNCTHSGENKYVCALCGGEELREVPALGHSGEVLETVAPTCTEAGYTRYHCTVCGEEWNADAVDALDHNWADATCVNPKTCTVCGETDGEALGHNWRDATCTDPKTCMVCGETDGEALGHNWQDATCADPKTCTVCGETDGEALGHNWQDATCVDPMTCTVCSATNGEALGHDYSAVTVPPTIEEDGYTEYTCTVCGHTYRDDYVSFATRGDLDGDGERNTDDAIYLLYNVMFGDEDYPISQPGDLNGDGETNTDDAIYLLYCVMFGEEDYPLA